MNFPFDQDITLENEVALLRPLHITDFDNLVGIALVEKDLLQYSPAQINTEKLLLQYLEKAIHERQDAKRYSFSIFDKRKNKYAGSTSFLTFSNADDRLEIGSTWIGTAFQKSGLNRNCKYLLLEYAFDTLGAVRVELKTDERNSASRNAIERIGGKFEGIMRSYTLMYNGFRRNTVCYSILKDEWAVLKSDLLKKVSQREL